MKNYILAVFNFFNVAFLFSGVLILTYVVLAEKERAEVRTIENVSNWVVMKICPMKTAIVNAALIFITFMVAIPALFKPLSRGCLRIHGWLIVLCAILTLVIGLTIWYNTLRTIANFGELWNKETIEVQALLQSRFNCCGYNNSPSSLPFIQGETCPDAVVAALKGGCVGPMSSYANKYLGRLFTTAFGFVGLDVVLLLCAAVVLKQREEMARYLAAREKNDW